jgi:hypothetical protein
MKSWKYSPDREKALNKCCYYHIIILPLLYCCHLMSRMKGKGGSEMKSVCLAFTLVDVKLWNWKEEQILDEDRFRFFEHFNLK